MNEPFTAIRELAGFAIYAGGGYCHAAAGEERRDQDQTDTPLRKIPMELGWIGNQNGLGHRDGFPAKFPSIFIAILIGF